MIKKEFIFGFLQRLRTLNQITIDPYFVRCSAFNARRIDRTDIIRKMVDAIKSAESMEGAYTQVSRIICGERINCNHKLCPHLCYREDIYEYLRLIGLPEGNAEDLAVTIAHGRYKLLYRDKAPKQLDTVFHEWAKGCYYIPSREDIGRLLHTEYNIYTDLYLFHLMPSTDGLKYRIAESSIGGRFYSVGVCGNENVNETKIKIPERYGQHSVCVIYNAFQKNKAVTDIVIPVTVHRISKEAFVGCVNLQRICIPKGVTVIEDDTFKGCDSLTDIYYQGSDEDWNKLRIITERVKLTSVGCGAGFTEKHQSLPGNEILLSARKHFSCIW